MGYMRHHTIVVTSFSDEKIRPAHDRAVDVFGSTASSIVEGVVNGHCSFFIAPDGSKEGWPESDTGDRLRAEFIKWLDGQRFGDGSSPFDWAEIQFGDDCHVTKIVCHSDEKQRRKKGGVL